MNHWVVVVVKVVEVVEVVVVVVVPSMDGEKKKHSHGGLLQSCHIFRGQV